jgi:hypothetical protein
LIDAYYRRTLIAVGVLVSSSLFAGSNCPEDPVCTNDGERTRGEIDTEGDCTAAAAAAAADTYLLAVDGMNELLLNALRRC